MSENKIVNANLFLLLITALIRRAVRISIYDIPNAESSMRYELSSA